MKVKTSFCIAAFTALASLLAVAQTDAPPAVVTLGQIQNPDIAESSGIIPARGKSGGFWVHNDSGVDNLYAITAEGESMGQWKIKDVDLQNWEDIAAVGSRLYVADIGNNEENRETVTVYSIPHPPANKSGELSPNRSWVLEYPDHPFDSESFFVYKSSGYLISKELSRGEVRIYRFPLNKKGAKFTLEKLGKLNVNDEARGADITRDGKRLAVITGSGAYLFGLTNGIPSDGILDPVLFVPFDHNSMEGCCFTPDGLVVTSESRDLYLFTDPLFSDGAKGKPRKNRR
jgi:hypothetical protein